MPETHTVEVTTYALAELKELDGRGFANALYALGAAATEYDWWEDELEYWIADQVQERWGITFDPKQVTFDLDRADYLCFGKTSDVDDKVFLKAAGIDLRTRAARAIYEDGGNLVLGVRHNRAYGSRNWIGFYEYEFVPDYIEDMQPGITEKIEDALVDATDFAKKVLRDEFENLTSEEHLLDWADNNNFRFEEDGSWA
jgi:hypothetical protein